MKKTIWMTAAVVCILAAGAAGIIGSNSEPARRTSAKKVAQKEVAAVEESIQEEKTADMPEVSEPQEAVREEIKTENVEKAEKTEETAELKQETEETPKQDEINETADAPKEEKPLETQSNSQQSQTEEKKEPEEDIDEVVSRLEEEEQKDESIKFPYEIPGTELVIQKIEPFDGIFLEDGSDEAVSNVTTMLLENKGYQDIEYAEISVKCADQKLVFEVSILPGGSSMIVQEKNKAQYRQGTCTEVKAETAEAEELSLFEKQIKITEKGNDSLEVTNLTEDTITTVRIFYKYYMEDEDVYVGGITYTAKIDELAAGGSKLVTPKHYMDGNSQVVMVRIYE